MKSKIVIAFLLISVFTLSTARSQSKFDSWPELKEFHGVMSQTFHPSEEGNLEPIKTRVDEMIAKAEALQKSSIPAEFNTPEVKAAVDELVIGSKALKALITEGASDKKITKSLSDLHDTFHKIVGLCSHENH